MARKDKQFNICYKNLNVQNQCGANENIVYIHYGKLSESKEKNEIINLEGKLIELEKKSYGMRKDLERQTSNMLSHWRLLAPILLMWAHCL